MELLDPVLAWLNGIARILGAEPALIPSIICVAVLCRFLRAGVEAFASGWMYLLIIGVGVAAGCTPWFGGSRLNPGAASLAFVALTLLLQRGLQGIAEWNKLPAWVKVVLPADNQNVRPAPADPVPPTSKP